ncbi:MAG: ABC transporter substrate-binding protein [Candidatus Bathyarchaeota archaeon]|nr:ABC transporter substrate-binding protein [Candidatus Bathyarchaeota archaeon]
MEAVSKQRIGNIENPDPEEVAALDPDLVIMYSFYGKGDPSIEAIEKFGFPIIAICPGTFENFLRDIELIGNSTGKFSEAKALVSGLKERLEYISNLTSNVAYKQRVYFEFWYPPPTTAGPGSWPHSLIEIAGGTNIFGDATTK